MTVKERLKEIVEELSEGQAHTALPYLESLRESPEITAPPQRKSARGILSDLPGGSEEFIQLRQKDMELEDPPSGQIHP